MTRAPLTDQLPGPSPTPTSPVGASVTGVGVLGATGYTGQELLRLLAAHPHVRLLALGSRQQAGQAVADAFPGLGGATGGAWPTRFEDDPAAPDDAAAWRARGIELVFSALPHGAFAARAAAFKAAGITVIDLSADFRPGAEAEWAGRHAGVHPAPELIDEALYGLTEWVDWAPLVGAQRPWLVANPGCYATAILLAALPAAQAGWWSGAPLVVNALSGVSGAGRAASLTTHFVECGGGASPYRVGETHQHRAEIAALLGTHAPGTTGALVFNPHLVPMARGIAANVAIPLSRAVTPEEAEALYAAATAERPFLRLLPTAGGALPETRHVKGSNRCDLALRVVAEGRMLVVFSAIDNLVKGAAGQAVQNMNRLMGWPEDAGLPREAWPCV